MAVLTPTSLLANANWYTPTLAVLPTALPTPIPYPPTPLTVVKLPYPPLLLQLPYTYPPPLLYLTIPLYIPLSITFLQWGSADAEIGSSLLRNHARLIDGCHILSWNRSEYSSACFPCCQILISLLLLKILNKQKLCLCVMNSESTFFTCHLVDLVSPWSFWEGPDVFMFPTDWWIVAEFCWCAARFLDQEHCWLISSSFFFKGCASWFYTVCHPLTGH